jgi:hypothetical protein
MVILDESFDFKGIFARCGGGDKAVLTTSERDSNDARANYRRLHFAVCGVANRIGG